MKVEQLINDRGNAVANQFVITGGGSITFQSYKTKIAVLKDSTVTLGVNWDLSNTTIKHLYIFLRDFAHLNVCGKEDVYRYADKGKIKFTKQF